MKTLSLDDLKIGQLYGYDDKDTHVLFKPETPVQVFDNILHLNNNKSWNPREKKSSLGRYRLCSVLASSAESDREHVEKNELLPIYHDDCGFVSEVLIRDIPLYVCAAKVVAPETEAIIKANRLPELTWTFIPDTRVQTVWACSVSDCSEFGRRIFLKPHRAQYATCMKCGRPLKYIKTEVQGG